MGSREKARSEAAAAGPGTCCKVRRRLSVADEHRDPSVTPELRVAESTGLDLERRHAGISQCVNNAIDITLVRAVDCDSGGRILIQVVRDLSRLVAVGPQNIVAVANERVILERAPHAHRANRAARTLGTGLTDCALRARCTSHALPACRAGSTGWARTTHHHSSFAARRSNRALHALGPGRAGGSRRSGHRQAGRAAVSVR